MTSARSDLEIRLLARDEASKVLDKAGKSGANMGKVIALGVATGAAAVVGLGVAALKIGGQFDAAYDTIRIGTGATGKDLQGLEKDFKAVVKSVPTDFGTASTAIADLNTRLGLTGRPLQDMAKQVINLSRLTGTDLGSNVANVTRVFGDWGVAAEDQSDTLDKLFRASQASGIGIDELAQKVVQFGAPLRAMGFSIDESTALLAKWEKEGVNSELVLGSLRIAMGNFARDNIPMRDGLDQTIAKIQELGPGAEATSLAMEIFGARAGPDMAAAILEGRLSYEEMLAVIVGGSDTINQAAADTDDWRESLTLLKNNALVVIEPVAARVFEGLGTVIGRVTELARLFSIGVNGGAIGGEFSTIERFAFSAGQVMRNDVIPAFLAGKETFEKDILPALQTLWGFVRDDALPIATQLVSALVNDATPAFTTLAGILKDHVIPVIKEVAESFGAILGPAIEGAIIFLGNHTEVVWAVVAAWAAWKIVMGIDDVIFIARTSIMAVTAVLTTGLIPALIASISTYGFMTTAQMALNLAMSVNPIGIVIIAIAALVAAGVLLYKNWDTVAAMAGELWATISTAFGGIKDSIVGAFNDAVAGVRGAINSMIGYINRLIGAWNGLEFSAGGGSILGVPIPSVSFGTPDLSYIPQLATGGIVRARPGGTLALLGEGGHDEAVVPLNRGGAVGGNNYGTVQNIFPNVTTANEVLSIQAMAVG